MNPVDLLIIGAGPTGLFGAFYAGLRQMSVALVDSLQILGGQLTTLRAAFAQLQDEINVLTLRLQVARGS